MAEYKLMASAPLNGYKRDYDGVRVREITNRAIFSLAIPVSGLAALQKTVCSVLKIDIPPCGNFVATAGDAKNPQVGMLARLSSDKLLFMFDDTQQASHNRLKQIFSEKAYLVEQTDAWVVIEISGVNSRKALERICPLDLHPDEFSAGKIAQTKMEHLAAIISCKGKDCFQLMSGRSSAKSFLNSIETSVSNIL